MSRDRYLTSKDRSLSAGFIIACHVVTLWGYIDNAPLIMGAAWFLGMVEAVHLYIHLTWGK